MAPGVTSRDVVRTLAQSGGLSILIKVANGILAYVMLLIIARVATTEQYGVFAVAFSIAMSVSIIATLGQPRVVARFWPQWSGQNQPLKAQAVLRLSMVVVAVGLGAVAAMILIGGALGLIAATPWTFGVAAATALFTFVLGWAEFSSTGLRAQGFVVKALAPRDVAWRVGVCVVFGVAAMAGWSFDAQWIVLIIAAILALMVAPQLMMLHRSTTGATIEVLPSTDRKILSQYSVVMWTITSFQLARSFAGVVIVSAFLGAEAAGAYFTADRTANLLAFLLLAVNLISEPLIARYYHSDRKELVRVIAGMSGLAAGFTALAGLVIFFIFGTEILVLFDPVYASYVPILLILSCGQFVSAATGPVGPLLVLSGHERVSLIVIAGVGGASIALQLIGGLYYGPVGVATGAAAGPIIANLITASYAWRVLRIDTSGFSLAFRWLRRLHGNRRSGPGTRP